MNENSVVSLRQEDKIDDPLTEILRTGARRLITRAVEVEFDTAMLPLHTGPLMKVLTSYSASSSRNW